MSDPDLGKMRRFSILNGRTVLCNEPGSHTDPCDCGSPSMLWDVRTTSSGRFEKAKKQGDVFRGAKREDEWSFWDVWDALDTLHRSLLFLLVITTTGLGLHALGVFC